MRTLATALALAVVSAGAALAAEPATPEDFVAMESRRSAAIVAHDMAFLDSIYAGDFKGVTATGYQVDKPTLMQVFRRDDPDTRFTLDQVEARVMPGAAMTTGRVTGRTAAGEVLSQFRFLHVWEKRGGHWVLVAGSGTDIPPARRQ
jgi:hypothetical protein